jgi:hypothetical protein
MSLLGKTWAYESPEQVREVIAKNSFNSLQGRARSHQAAAERLKDSYAFQPGLIDLHDELNDTWHYLTALAEQARQTGYVPLANDLTSAAAYVRVAVTDVARAAEATVPSEAPATK